MLVQLPSCKKSTGSGVAHGQSTIGQGEYYKNWKALLKKKNL